MTSNQKLQKYIQRQVELQVNERVEKLQNDLVSLFEEMTVEIEQLIEHKIKQVRPKPTLKEQVKQSTSLFKNSPITETTTNVDPIDEKNPFAAFIKTATIPQK